MSRPALEVADLIRTKGNEFLERYGGSLSFQQRKAFRAIQNCRTPALGGHKDHCPRCGFETVISYNSCRNRHCPKCQGQARERWIEARQEELLPTTYFHVTFTVPHELNVLALRNPREIYDLLFQASARSLLQVAADPAYLGAEIGLISILHTWGQNLLLHPHVHCLVPGGGISPDHAHWMPPKKHFFLPRQILCTVFRHRVYNGLKRLYRQHKLSCTGLLQEPRQFRKYLRQLYRSDWVVDVRESVGGPAQVLRYLGRYTHRIAISNHRLVAFDGERVTFRWKDYKHGGKYRLMKLAAVEFLRRLFLHVLPKGFVRIRYAGYLASRFRHQRLTLCRHLLDTPNPQPNMPVEDRPPRPSTWHCPRCGSPMVLLQRFNALELPACIDSS